MPTLRPRDDDYECYTDINGRYYCRRTAWNDWVRWLVLALIIGGFFFLFVLCSCITARRRRRAGHQPFYGTGWAARPGNNYTTQQPQPYYHNQPAPPYSPHPQNSYYGQNQGYYSQPYGQQQGVELQSPPPAHARSEGAENVYQPPPGPPPTKV